MSLMACKKCKQIVDGYVTLAGDIIAGANKYAFTDERVRACQKCDDNYWIFRRLMCKHCKCFIPAKARSPDAECPKGKWRR
ncbi:MAG: hypothetical protein WBC45_05000 [Atribacterota bacterium]